MIAIFHPPSSILDHFDTSFSVACHFVCRRAVGENQRIVALDPASGNRHIAVAQPRERRDLILSGHEPQDAAGLYCLSLMIIPLGPSCNLAPVEAERRIMTTPFWLRIAMPPMPPASVKPASPAT